MHAAGDLGVAEVVRCVSDQMAVLPVAQVPDLERKYKVKIVYTDTHHKTSHTRVKSLIGTGQAGPSSRGLIML